MLVISAHIAIIFKKENFRESTCPWFSQGWILTVVWQLEAETVSSREGVTPRQAGTWDPLLQSLHLGEPLQQQHRETVRD